MAFPVALDANGNADIPGVVAYMGRDFYPGTFERLDAPDYTRGWADTSRGVMVYAPNGEYRIRAQTHRFLEKVLRNGEEVQRMYELFVDPAPRLQLRRIGGDNNNVVATLLNYRAILNHLGTVTIRRNSFYLGEEKVKFLQRHFPILGVRRERLPEALAANVYKFHIFPATSQVVRSGFALATFYDNPANADDLMHNHEAPREQRRAAQSIWTSLLLPFLAMVQPFPDPQRNVLDVRIVLTFVASSNNEDSALFYLNMPVRHVVIDNTNTWLRELQYYFLDRLRNVDIARTDSDRHIESLQLATVTFVRRVHNAGPGGFLPFVAPDSNTSNAMRAKETLKQNAYTWADERGWYLASYKNVSAKENHDRDDGKTKKLCLYWACLKGIRLIELSHYGVPSRWQASKAPTALTLQAEVHKHLVQVMKVSDVDDSDGVSYGSPILQALANILCVDIRINDCNWNVLTHYTPDFSTGGNYPLRDHEKATAANRQLFSLSPIIDTPTIVLCLLEHPSDCMPGGIKYDKVVEDWSSSYSDSDVVSRDTTVLRVPGNSVIPFHDKLHSYWHYWLVVAVQTEVERDMLASESISVDYIPWCSKCDKLGARKPLLGCRLHGPSPANSGDRRRRNFKKVVINKCYECSMSYFEGDRHVCKRKCPHCYHRISASSWDTHVCFTIGRSSPCPTCGVRVRNLDSHFCNENNVSWFNKQIKGNDVKMWKLGKTVEFSKNKFEGYIIWDLETFPCKEQNDRMVVYRCGLYHNSFAGEQMGLDGEYHDFVCTCATDSGFGNVIHQMLEYIAKPFFNNYIAISYFGSVFDHYLLLHDILSNPSSSLLFRVSQPDFDTKDKSNDVSSERSGSSLGSNSANGLHNRVKKKHAEEDFQKSNWVVKSKRIFSMWLSEPVEDIAPRYVLKFIDLGLFTQCSLSQACKDFGLSKEESKDIFPHDFISCWDDLKYVGPVPDKKFFPISCREEASVMKWKYEMDGKQWNLLEVSEEYLRKDVMSTRQLFLKFSSTLSDRLNIALTSSITLPSLAQKVLKLNLDRLRKSSRGMLSHISLPSTPTVGSDFRKSIFGGRVMPMRDKFVSPALEDVECDLVLLRRAYSVIVQYFLEYVMSRIHNMVVGHDSVVPEVLIPLKRCLSECIAALPASAPENIVLLIKGTHLPLLDDACREKFAMLMSETTNSMDWNDFVAIQFDRVKAAGCLRAVDVSSLYPHSMAGFDYPVGPYQEASGIALDSMTESALFMYNNCDFSDLRPSRIKQRIADLRSRDSWPSCGIFYVRYVPNQNLSIPVLPRKELKLLLWDLVSSEGWYNSVDIETAIAFGYRVEFLQGYVWEKSGPVFRDVINDLYKIKQEAEEAGDMTLRSIAKLLMNSMYGKMLQKPVKESVELLYTDNDLSSFLKRNLWTGFESVGCSDTCVLAFGVARPNDPNEEGFVEWDEHTISKADGTTVDWLDGQPIQLGSFILGYSRRVMMLYFAAINPGMKVENTPFYTDTDSIFLSDEQYRMLEEQELVRDGLGFLADDFKGGIGMEAYFTNPKSYIVTKIKKAKGSNNAELYSHIKAKGIAKSCLSQTYKMGYMDEGDCWLLLDFDRASHLLSHTADSLLPQKEPNHSVSISAVRRGEVGMCSDPELFALMNEWTAMDPASSSRESPFVPPELRGHYEEMTWIEQPLDADCCETGGDARTTVAGSGDEDELLSRHLTGIVLHAQTPDEKRDERLARSKAMGKLDKESFIQSRRQYDGKSKRPVTESVSFPTFKRFLGRNRIEVESGATNFSIVPRTICRSFGSRIYLGACFLPELGVYQPWRDGDLEVNGVGNAALARGGAKGEKWAQQFDEEMDKSLFL